MVNKPNSLFCLFGEVTGVTQPTLNTARKATAGVLNAHSYLSTQESRLQHHHHKVSLTHYDKGLASIKMSATCYLAEISKDTLEAEENPKHVQDKRFLRDIQDNKAATEAAEMLLSDASKRRYPVNRKSSQWNMTKEERTFVKQFLSNKMEKEFEEYKGKVWSMHR